MKKSLLVLLIAILSIGFTSIAVSAEKEKGKGHEKAAQDAKTPVEKGKAGEEQMKERAEKGPMPRGESDYMERIKERMDRMKAEHDAEVEKLQAIKDMADKENAPKTAALVQDLIAAKNAEYDKQVENFKKMEEQMKSRYKERLEEMSKRREKLDDDREKQRQRAREFAPGSQKKANPEE